MRGAGPAHIRPALSQGPGSSGSGPALHPLPDPSGPAAGSPPSHGACPWLGGVGAGSLGPARCAGGSISPELRCREDPRLRTRQSSGGSALMVTLRTSDTDRARPPARPQPRAQPGALRPGSARGTCPRRPLYAQSRPRGAGASPPTSAAPGPGGGVRPPCSGRVSPGDPALDGPPPAARPPSGLDRGSEEGAGGGPRPRWGQAGRGRTRADPAPRAPGAGDGFAGRAPGPAARHWLPRGRRKWHLFCGGGGGP